MFTGIIQEIGTVLRITPRERGKELEFSCRNIYPELKIGDSVACNGVCLTVSELRTGIGFKAFAVGETLSRSNLSKIRIGDTVNFELSLLPDSRMGGHFVMGHVDSVTEVIKVQVLPDESREIFVSIPNDLTRYCVEKGSVALNGVSLTVAEMNKNHLKVALIPHTLRETNLSQVKMGDLLNLEVDIMGKYAEKLLRSYLPDKPNVTQEYLASLGYHA
jgi:riboflavin synthase